MSDIFYLTEAVFDEIIMHAREGKPQEVCGVLRGRGSHAFQLVRGRNVAPDPIKDYVLDPQTLLRQFDFEEEGDEMVAIYHSHPVSAAYPSGSDAWSAHYPDCVYLICSLEDDERPVIRAFRLIAHEIVLDFDQLGGALDFDETRPGRFAYYQAPGMPIPSAIHVSCAQIATPFYVVFESLEESGKNYASRVVSIIEEHIEVVPDRKDA